MYSSEEQSAIREDVFAWLDAKLLRGQYEYKRDDLTGYEYRGDSIPLVDAGRGIRNPRQLDSTLSILTSLQGPYDDSNENELAIEYHYRTGDSADNQKLMLAFERREPMVYFKGIRRAVYVAYYPVYAIANNSVARTFTIALDETLTLFGDPLAMSVDQRRYADRVVRQRLHQPAFRARVMHAYVNKCSVCRINHPGLLDAAHIVPDWHSDGFATVANGIALCKLHHAAYDRNLLGITQDYEIRVNEELLHDSTIGLLKAGFQDLHGELIAIPSRASERPSRDALGVRFADFH